MTRELDLSDELAAWAETASYSVTPGTQRDDGRTSLSGNLGEFRLFVGYDTNGWVAVTRSERMEEEHFVLATPTVEVAEKYLLGYLGRVIRNIHRLPRLRLPAGESMIADGFTLTHAIFGGGDRYALADSNGTIAVSSTDRVTATMELVRLSYYLLLSFEDLRASYLNLDGSPLTSLAAK
jgi:hypothetical protein